ncbi:hypothetical protein BPIT_17000 [Candidatus Brocadia pituitae]|nr:hypothetical protein BPIT_17000 [Candidatus Brocadia pituitae]
MPDSINLELMNSKSEGSLYQHHKSYGGVNKIRLKLNVNMIKFVLFNTKLTKYEKGKM